MANQETGQGLPLAEVADEMLAETVEATSAEDAAQAAVADEVLAKVAAGVVEGDGLPEHTGPPTVAVLGGWLAGQECPPEVWAEANERLGPVVSSLIADDTEAWLTSLRANGVVHFMIRTEPSLHGVAGERQSIPISASLTIEDLDKAWQDYRKGQPPDRRTGFPLTPVVRAWLHRPTVVEPERRRRGILPRDTALRMNHRLPGFDTPPPSRPGLVEVPEVEVPEVAHLPGLVPDRPPLPVLLDLYDRALQGAHTSKRGVASVAIRLFIESLLSLPAHARDGELHRLVLPVREVVGEWLAWKIEHYRPHETRGGGALRRALAAVRDMAVDMPRRDGKTGQGGWYYPVMISAVEGLLLDNRLEIIMRLPQGSGVGPPVDRQMLRKLGKTNSAAYRAHLALCCEWDRVGGHRGKLILPTRPVVLRNSVGQLLSGRGDVLLDRSGRPVTSHNDRRAVQMGEREPNPARTAYHAYDADGVLALCYNLDTVPADNRRHYLDSAVRALETMEQAGACVIERLNESPQSRGLPWRIMPGGG